MADGKYAAYKSSTPITANFGQDVFDRQDQRLKQSEEERRQREEERTIAEDKRLEQERQQKKDEAYQEKMSKIRVGTSGVNTHDGKISDLLVRKGGLIDQYNQVLTDLESSPRDPLLIAKRTAIESSVERLQGIRTGLVNKGESVNIGTESGELDPLLNEDFKSNFKSLNKDINYDYNIDENGNVFVENYDANGDGIPDKITLEDLQDPDKLKIYKKFDYDTWADETKKEYGKLSQELDIAGNRTTKTEGFDEKNRPSLVQDVEDLFGADVSNMSDEAMSYIASRKKINPLKTKISEDQFKLIKAEMVNEVVNRYDKKKDNTQTYAPTSSSSAADPNKKALEARAKTLGNIQPVSDSKNVIKEYKDKSTTGFDKATGYVMKDKPELGVGDQTLKVASYYISDDGRVSITGARKTGEKEPKVSTSEKADGTNVNISMGGEVVWENIKGQVLTDEQATDFAVALGFENTADLVTESKNKAGTKKAQTSDKSSVL